MIITNRIPHNKKWTPETVIAEIKRLAEEGIDLSYISMQDEYSGLLRASSRYYKDWPSALEAAGLDYTDFRRNRTWTKKDVIREIKARYKRGDSLNWSYIATPEGDIKLSSAALRKFRSWDNALQAAGINPDDVTRNQRWDREKICTAIMEMMNKGEKISQTTIRKKSPQLLYAVYRIYFSITSPKMYEDIVELRTTGKLTIDD
ncbi:MAG: hypothetical protein WCO98_15050 [bacterium]